MNNYPKIQETFSPECRFLHMGFYGTTRSSHQSYRDFLAGLMFSSSGYWHSSWFFFKSWTHNFIISSIIFYICFCGECYQGLEYVDGECSMSCVVTNKWSDWSTQTWKSNKLALRVHKIQNDYVVQTPTFWSFSFHPLISSLQ